MIPTSLLDSDKTRVMATKITEQILEHPEKFANTNVEFLEKFHQLIGNSISRFMGKPTAPIIESDNRDRRFKDNAWNESIFFDFVKQYYLLSSDYIKKHVTHFELDKEHKDYLHFLTKHFIDAFSPSNFAFFNPTVLKESLESGWQNIVKGMDNFLDDIKKSEDVLNIKTTDKSAFKLGKNIAATPGKVVFENELIQLICYEPKETAYSIPMLIIPPWINKYYILDLSENNSLVKWLVQNNFQVFIVSWVNPNNSLSHIDFEDYMNLGIIEVCDYLRNKQGFKKINTAGYCIGGTLLAAAVSYLNATKKDLINSCSFLTTLLDFEAPGEVGIFINENSINAIENEMRTKGYFDGRYLSNSFSLLRANDLVWSFFVNNYLLGKTPLPYDLLYWNADSTNLPATMHSYYLRNMYQKNLLKIPKALTMLGEDIDLSTIYQDTYFLAAQDDHIAPWKSVYNGVQLLGKLPTFCLTKSGHVAGVVNPPHSKKYGHYTNNTPSLLKVDDWFSKAQYQDESWWLNWKDWLSARSGNLTNATNYHGLDSIEPAPGRYVQNQLATR
jgi:polyhydroxyalkanoate synthase